MKKIAIVLICSVLILILGFSAIRALDSMTVLTGYSLKCENGAYMIIEETGSPIRYSFNKAIGTNVEKLADGDRILIISDLVNCTYPGSTTAHFVFRYAEGEREDIPEETLIQLSEMGWYKMEE